MSHRMPEHVLITGAAGAIGGALAREMRIAWPAARLALLDRPGTQPALAALAHELDRSYPVIADLRDIDGLPAIITPLGSFDGLVNCAGVMTVRGVDDWQWSAAHELLAIDLLAPLRLQDLVVRTMVERGRGLIVNVTSMAGRVALKGCSYYGAAKAGLGMASEIARAELAPRGITVVTVYPGPVHSQLEQAGRAGYGNAGGWFGRLAPVGDAGELARHTMRAIARDEPRVIYPKAYRLGWRATDFARWFAFTFGPRPARGERPRDAEPLPHSDPRAQLVSERSRE